jgi:polyhydroxyalkanoate synthesis regulator phasin
MPKKKQEEKPAEQSKRFVDAVRELEAAGELNPIEAERAISDLVRSAALKKKG